MLSPLLQTPKPSLQCTPRPGTREACPLISETQPRKMQAWAQHLPFPETDCWKNLSKLHLSAHCISICLISTSFSVKNSTQGVSAHIRGFLQLWRSERSSDATSVTELINGRENMQTQICLLLLPPCPFLPHCKGRDQLPVLCACGLATHGVIWEREVI